MQSTIPTNAKIALWLLLTIPGWAAGTDLPMESSSARGMRYAAQLVAQSRPGYYTNQVIIDRNLNPRCNTSLPTQCFKAPLPVTLFEFRGKRLDEASVQLNWSTSKEIQNDHFGIQRSLKPDEGFESVGVVKGQGNSSTKVSYAFVDPNTSADITYYRLQQMDQNGSYEYSPVISIEAAVSALSLTVFPNPGPGAKKIRIRGLKTQEPIDLDLYDHTGKPVYTQKQSYLDEHQQLQLPASLRLSPGRYTLQIHTQGKRLSSAFQVNP